MPVQLESPAPLRQVSDLTRRLAAHGSRTALVQGDVTVSYGELARRVDDAAARLDNDRGPGRGRRLVLVVGSHDVSLIAAYLGAICAGHVVLLVPSGQHVQRWIDRYDPDVVLQTDPDDLRVARTTERRAGTVHDLHPDLVLLLTTSGSTGSPRLVRLSYEAVLANAGSIASYLELGRDDVGITTLPMAYCFGLSVLHSHLMAGAGLVLTELSVVDRCFWDLVHEHRVSSVAGVPYTFDLLDRTDLLHGRLSALPSLKRLLQAGGAMPDEQAHRYAQACANQGRQLFVMYGQTEATARMAYLPPHLALRHTGALGVAVPGGELTLAEDGELVYRGPNVMMGYADGPHDLARGRTVHELRTGDRGRLRPDGMLELVGRTGRQVKLFGLRIDLDEVTSRVRERGITAWCGLLDGRLVAVAEQDVGTTRQAICQASGLPVHAVRAVRVEALPRTVNGKIDARDADRMARATLDETAGPSHQRPGNEVRGLYAAVLGRPAGPTDTFVGLGGDSLSYVEVSLRLSDLLPTVPDDWPTRSVSGLQALLASDGTAAGPTGEAGRSSARSRYVPVDTTVVLRAVGILLVVASHAKLSPLLGGAHTLLAVAGYNFARFRPNALSRRERLSGTSRSITRLVTPVVLIVAAASIVTPGVGIVQVLQLNAWLGPDVLGPAWRYWFLEALIQLLIVMSVLMAIPQVDRFERRHPFALPVLLLGLGLLPRIGVVDLGPGPAQTQSSVAVLWLFVLGWSAARATRRRHRMVITAVAVLSVPGFFSRPSHDAVVLLGVLLLVWRPTVPFPRRLPLLRTALGAVASASLFIYLVQWQVLDLTVGDPRLLVLVASVAAGLLATRLWDGLRQALRTRVARTTAPRGCPPRASSRRVVTYPTSMSTCRSSSQPMLTAAAASGTEPPNAASSGTRIDRNSTHPSMNPAISEPVPYAPQRTARVPGRSGANAR